MKRFSIVGLIGAVVFGILSTWLGPKMIGWYVTPADQPALLTCQAAVVGAMARLVHLQIIGTAIGFAVGLLLAFLFRKRLLAAAEATPAAPASASSSAPAAKKQ